MTATIALEPCTICGAPVSEQGGHDAGCAYETADDVRYHTQQTFRALLAEIDSDILSADSLATYPGFSARAHEAKLIRAAVVRHAESIGVDLDGDEA